MTTPTGKDRYCDVVGGRYYNSTTGEWEERPFQVSTDGAAYVAEVGRPGMPSNRETGAVATAQSLTWTEDEGVLRVIITAIGAETDSVAVCFDAPDDATATAWLAGNAAANEATMRTVVMARQAREFTFANPLRRLDVVDYVGTVDAVFVEAGK